jgi:integrase
MRKQVRAVLMSFFKWAQAEFKLPWQPVVPIRPPRLRDVERELFSAEGCRPNRRRAIRAPRCVALKLFFLMGLRKGDLAAALLRLRPGPPASPRARQGRQDPAHAYPTEDLRHELAEVSRRRDPLEHLLLPQKRGPKGKVIWEDRRKPLFGPALHRWRYRYLTRAGVVDEGTTSGKKMHGARYTSGTEFYLATGDIYATQQLLGHADLSTTANIYVHGWPADLETKLRKVLGRVSRAAVFCMSVRLALSVTAALAPRG